MFLRYRSKYSFLVANKLVVLLPNIKAYRSKAGVGVPLGFSNARRGLEDLAYCHRA